jgi:RHS repeat-associated protein
MTDTEKRPSGETSSQERSPFAPPQLELPKGGGAIRGMGEKFSVDAARGTASLTVPIAISEARSGFTPQLSVHYDSGTGNGEFGMGWGLFLPAIARKTEKGLPRYEDASESDVFLLSGVEDLVPALRYERHQWVAEEWERSGYRIKRYRPRIEGLFARIERWTSIEDGDTHWRSISPDNVLTIYGDTPQSRISDPACPEHIFKWLISESYDAKGNAIHYEYVAEDDRNVNLAAPGERNRTRTANRYLKRVLYGNRKPMYRGSGAVTDPGWMFELVLDYGEEGGSFWRVRADPFSSYRSGFEIRTYRLCRRALLFHHFPEELGAPRYLVRSTDFAYRERETGSFLTRVIQCGYVRQPDGSYLRRSLPPLELTYSRSPLEAEHPGPFELREADAENLPEGIDGDHYRWVDLDGEGISGVLTEQGTGWYYKHNLGQGHFSKAELVSRKPATAALAAAGQQLLDVKGSGNLNLVELSADCGGFYERTPNETGTGLLGEVSWGQFRAFSSFPVLDWSDPNLRFVDLTGDGIADILITDDIAFRWHPSLLSHGFGLALHVPVAQDERQGPRVLFADGEQSLYLADMSGDGLSDLVRIRNGEVCYWPNLGYGRFGSKITMGGSPWFDPPDLFDQRRIRLADTDGNGVTDILYLSESGVHVYLNQSGNSWSERRVLTGVPAGDLKFVSVTDFLGRGTACLVWSSPLAGDAPRPLRYVDLMCGQKPHLLTRIANHLGAETRIEYASSTEFYLADKAAGQPWVTRLPFPVHVVKRVETYDYVSRNRFVSTNTYHHGYFDAVEREFRGFGRVDQLDTEQFGTQEGDTNGGWSVPPVLTKTWYHTGVFLGADRVSRHMAHEYYLGPGEGPEMLLEDTILPPELAAEEAREACRALKGSLLRQEVYALDDSEESARPYKADENNYTIRPLQPRAQNRHAVFFTHAREKLTFNYERKLYQVDGAKLPDPRTLHTVTLAVDDFGNVLQSVSIGYGRRIPDSSELLTQADRDAQVRLWATLSENRYTNVVCQTDEYRTPLIAEASNYELYHLSVTPDRSRFSFADLRKIIAQLSDGAHDILPEDIEGVGATSPAVYRRLFQQTRTFYRSDELDRFLPLGRLEARALPGQQYELAFTPGLLTKIYRRDGEDLLPDRDAVLAEEAGYVDLDQDGNWWAPSGRMFYSPGLNDGPSAELSYAKQHFFLPLRFEDPFGKVTSITYDAHDLSPVEVRDPLGNVVRAGLDYRVLRPAQVTDANGNRSEAAFDALGMIAGTALRGKAGEEAGDSLEGFVPDLPESVLLEHFKDPLQDPHAILGKATTRLLYDLFAFDRTRSEQQPQPVAAYTLVRETHQSDLRPGEQTKLQHAFSYSDGLGREIQKKIQAEPAPGTQLPRWVGSGWKIFDNKGNPVRQYEPFFSSTHAFEFASVSGVSPTLLYDPAGRVMATLRPNHTYEKVVFDPWSKQSWDLNDTVLGTPREDPDVAGFLRQIPPEEYLPAWYQQRADGSLGQAERDAAVKAAAHAGTPARAYADALGRTFLSIDHNRFREGDRTIQEFYRTRSELDIQGNQLRVMDARERVIMAYAYDLRGVRIFEDCPDSGKRWTLSDITGKPVLAFDSRNRRFRREYDALRRPVALFIKTGEQPERLAERTEYGDGQPDAAAHNLRTRVFRQFDGAGIVTNIEYDFKGNLLHATRQLLSAFRDEVDWAASPALEPEIFHSRTSYDALNRPLALTAPDGSVIRPSYNEANLLEQLHVRLKGAEDFTPFVTNIDYNAKGQRELIEYASGARTSSDYDPLTFRLVHLQTVRSSDNARLQDLTYVYDPVGNISSITDVAQQTVYFKNQVVSPSNDYTYDAVYRLLSAKGREHIGRKHHPQTSFEDLPRMHQPLPADSGAMQNYREHYRYDAVGNLLQVLHHAADGNWTRHYFYEEISLNNRLSATKVGDAEDHYSYDPHGNMTQMQHLPLMKWDAKDQLAATQTQVANGGRAETTYYVYDSSGQRVRKITETSSGKRRAQRIYLNGFEIYREYTQGSVSLERTTLHVMDDKSRVALIESRGDETTIRYQFGNHLGSCCLELDEDAAIISYEEYYPFGSTSYQAGRSVAEVSLKRYRFTGKERDEETRFYYFGARYYASWIGRWVSCDPRKLIDGNNMYVYTRNNPIIYSDRTGMQCDPTMQCCVDSTEPTPEEEARQQCVAPQDFLQDAGSTSNVAPPLALAISTSQYLFSQAVRPLDANGQPLEGTYYLWSDDVNKAAAKAMISQEGGWLMSQTPQHLEAAKQFADALRREASAKFPGQTFTDQELFAMAGPGKALELPVTEFRGIWDPASEDVALRAVFGGLPVQGNLITPPGPNTVQARIEQPAVAFGGKIMGGLQIGAGALNIYGGTQEQDPLLSALGIGGGSLQVAGGASWILGAARTSAPLMSFGAKASVIGAVITAPITISHAADDWNSGDQYRQLSATLDVAGIAAPPAAFLSAYNKLFVKPAAETFYEVARRDIAQMLGVPQSWVY